jgi:hypothetical protein
LLETKRELGAEMREVMLAGLSETARDELLSALQHVRANLVESLNAAAPDAAPTQPAEVKKHACWKQRADDEHRDRPRT